MLIDVDSGDDGLVKMVISWCGTDTGHKVRSPSGGTHLGFRLPEGSSITNRVRVNGLPVDVRTTGGVEIIPPSPGYSWLGEGLRPIAEVPVARIDWLIRTETRREVHTTISAESADARSLLYRGRRYIDTFEDRAVSGCGGHTTAFVAGLKIVRFVRLLGGTEHDAWQLFLYYNDTKCDPPWDLSIPREEREYRHKFGDAVRLAR